MSRTAPPPMPFVPQPGPSEAFARPSGMLSTFSVTKTLLAYFHSNPEWLLGKQFLVPETLFHDSSEAAAYDAPSDDIVFKIVGIISREEGRTIEVLFEGCHVPDRRPFDTMLEVIASSKVLSK